jgi:hypothetical protein
MSATCITCEADLAWNGDCGWCELAKLLDVAIQADQVLRAMHSPTQGHTHEDCKGRTDFCLVALALADIVAKQKDKE